jgi:Starch-binding associating with outer membrane/Susd and RagB outer membrane lipoprotein
LQSTTDYNWNNSSFAGTWNFMYSSPLKDLEQLIAATGEKSPTYYGIALTLKAYAYMSLVDSYGDLPFTEAGLGDNGDKKVIYPKFDKDAEVYTACLKLLDDAIAQLAKPSPVTVSGDYIYGGNAARWSRLAKSLKLKFLMTARKGISGADAQIKSLITAGGFISGAADDFKFVYSKDINSIRSPYYNGPYTSGGDGGAYQNHQLMIEMLDEGDPRFAFYFRRQFSAILNQADPTERGATTCAATAPCKYGYFVLSPKVWKRLYLDKGKTPNAQDSTFMAGLFGRERGDVSGVPQDGSFRTIPGVYPGGGFHDFAYNTPAKDIKVPAINAAPGGGIFPALTEVNVMYYQLENILLLGGGTVAEGKTLFEKAIRTHIGRVVDFGVATDATYAVRPTADTTNQYVKKWLDRYDAAATNEAKMNVVAKQLWVSSIGNGTEIYNLYRRTGLPTTIDEPIAKTVRDFPRRLPYSQTELTLNPNAATYKSVAFDKDPVFWQK